MQAYGVLLFVLLVLAGLLFIMRSVTSSLSIADYTTNVLFILLILSVIFGIGFWLYKIVKWSQLAGAKNGSCDYTFLLLNIILFAAFLWIGFKYIQSHASTSHLAYTVVTYVPCILKPLIGIAGSLVLLYYILKWMGIYDEGASQLDVFGIGLINMIMLALALGIVYKVLNSSVLRQSALFRLLSSVFLYLPCLLMDLVAYVTDSNMGSETTASTKEDMKMLLIAFGLCVAYFLWIGLGKHYVTKKILVGGGKQLINDPIPLNTVTNVGSYETMSHGEYKYDYQYGLSMWIYLDSFVNASTTTVPLFSYGGNPSIKYNVHQNIMYVTVKQDKRDTTDGLDKDKAKDKDKETTTKDRKDQLMADMANQVVKTMNDVKSMLIVDEDEHDGEGDRILYKFEDIKLQRWNHIVINSAGGTMDMFLNGRLVKSAIEVSPFIKYDMMTVGSDKGANGDLCNLVYYSNPLTVTNINSIYYAGKNANPPTV